ncbi:MAG TPA: S8 family serine peptidase [Lachnospiraceae bacterium]|nr:S8 family serine peptidase [Lachnospiraceae bacterium]
MKKMNRKITTLLCIALLASILNTSRDPIVAASIPSDALSGASNDGFDKDDLDSVTDLDEYDSNEIIVTYKSDIIPSSEVAALSLNPSTDVEIISNDQTLVTVDSKSELSQKIAQYASDDNIASIQPNYTYTLLGGESEPYYPKQWGLSNDGTLSYYSDVILQNVKSKQAVYAVAGMDINIEDAWSLYQNGRDVTVAIVDTGVEVTHDDLKGSIFINEGEVPGDGIDNDKNGYVDDVNGWNFHNSSNDVMAYESDRSENDHGTHVAGIIGAQINGIGVAGIASNTNVSILPVKVLGGKEGRGTTLTIIKGIQYAELVGADICNLSLGTTSDDSLLRQTIQDSNMVFVVAAGNGDSKGVAVNNDLTPMYPASYGFKNVISVANIQCDGSLQTSSNYGANSVNIAAPGTYIYSTVTGNSYSYMSGTSMAAPMVSGALAEVYSYFDNITMKQAREVLLASARPIPSLSGLVSTGGIIDVYSALKSDISQFKDTGKPVITATVQSIPNSYKKNIAITAQDMEGNLKKVTYAPSLQEASFFEGGEKGIIVSLASNTGYIKGVAKSGTYTIYAVDSYGNETTYTVTVKVKIPSKVTLSNTSKTLRTGSTFRLGVTTNVSCSMTFKSSKKSVATVSASGKVTAVRKGTAIITVTTENGLKATCKITVK